MPITCGHSRSCLPRQLHRPRHTLRGRLRPSVEKAVDRTLAKFDEIVGFENLKVVHLNDSEDGLGSGHDGISTSGLGYIGTTGFKAILHHRAIRDPADDTRNAIDERRGIAGIWKLSGSWQNSCRWASTNTHIESCTR